MTTQSPPDALRLIRPAEGRLTIGIELPLDNDWSPDRVAQRQAAGLLFGVPDLSRYLELVRQVDAAGFAALWMRDVPVFDPQRFGDAGSVYDPFVNLGFLAGVTQRVALGTAAVVLPLRHPLMVAKAAASADRLSGGRLILGVASGDRPVEYPLMEIDFETRGAAFRDAVGWMRGLWQGRGIPHGECVVPDLDVLPHPRQERVPMILAGNGRQSPDWIAAQMQGRFVYPDTPERLAMQVADWRARRKALGLDRGVFISALHLDLEAAPDAPFQPFRFGGRAGRHALIAHLRDMATAGLDHLALLLRPSRRPVDAVLDELAQHVLPAV